jgi:hypothetical protein
MVIRTSCRMLAAITIAVACTPPIAGGASAQSLTQSQQAQLESYQAMVARLLGITPGGLAGPAGGPLTLGEIEANAAALFRRLR